MIYEGAKVIGDYNSRKYNVAVHTRIGAAWGWQIKYYYDEEKIAKRRAKAIQPLYGEVTVIPPRTTTKGKHGKQSRP